MNLSHIAPDCTGPWRPEPVQNEIYWRCEGCRAVAVHSDTIAQIAIEENLRRAYRRLLDDAGRWFRGEDLEDR